LFDPLDGAHVCVFNVWKNDCAATLVSWENLNELITWWCITDLFCVITIVIIVTQACKGGKQSALDLPRKAIIDCPYSLGSLCYAQSSSPSSHPLISNQRLYQLIGLCVCKKVLHRSAPMVLFTRSSNFTLNFAKHFRQAIIIKFSLCIKELFKLLKTSVIWFGCFHRARYFDGCTDWCNCKFLGGEFFFCSLARLVVRTLFCRKTIRQMCLCVSSREINDVFWMWNDPVYFIALLSWTCFSCLVPT